MRSHLPNNFPIQQKDRLFCKAIFSFLLRKQPSLLLNGEVIWQASDFSLTKELHDKIVKIFHSSREIIFGQLYRHLVTLYWSRWWWSLRNI